jgi:Arc/MetJ-type ribon-helix-helix transcriptional regulator
VKISVSLPDKDVDFLDALVLEGSAESRSASVHLAVRTLQASRLESAYEAAWREWHESGEAAAWDRTSSGRHDASR